MLLVKADVALSFFDGCACVPLIFSVLLRFSECNFGSIIMFRF